MIDPKQEAELLRLYQKSEGEFADHWIVGLYDRLDRENPAFAAKIDAARDILDATWVKVRAGTAGKDEFIKALTEWKGLHIKVLQKIGRMKG